MPLQRLSNVTAELQDGVMRTRMQPIGNAWQKLPRIVRDLSNELSKQIELEMIFPHARIGELQIIVAGAADRAGELAGGVVSARAAAVEDAEPDHQGWRKPRRGT